VFLKESERESFGSVMPQAVRTMYKTGFRYRTKACPKALFFSFFPFFGDFPVSGKRIYEFKEKSEALCTIVRKI
jgi:hypothetical protein